MKRFCTVDHRPSTFHRIKYNKSIFLNVPYKGQRLQGKEKKGSEKTEIGEINLLLRLLSQYFGTFSLSNNEKINKPFDFFKVP